MSDSVPVVGNDRLPPSDEAAERAVIGSALLDTDRVVHLMLNRFNFTTEHFYIPAHRVIVGALFEMVEAGRGVDLRTLSNWLKDRGQLDAAGGDAAIEHLIESTPTAAHAEFYCDIVRDKFIRRQLIDRAGEVKSAAYEDPKPATEQAQLAPELMAEAWGGEEDHRAKAEEVRAIKADIDVRTERVLRGETNVLIGLPTGLSWMDTITNGYQPGLYFIGARPSAGKTTLEGMSMERIVNECGPVLRCTNDSNRNVLMMRDASRLSGVSMPKALSGHCGHAQRERFYRELDRVAAWQQDFIVGENDIRSLCSQIRTGKKRKGYKAVSIDYVQTLRTGNPRVDANGNERMTAIAPRLKHLAFDLNIPIIVLSQLSRDCEKENREPRASDLRDGGELEQAADAILMLWKTPHVQPEPISLDEGGYGERKAVQIELVKYKNGFTGAKEFWMYGHYFKFEQAAPGWVTSTNQPPPEPEHRRGGKRTNHYKPQPSDFQSARMAEQENLAGDQG